MPSKLINFVVRWNFWNLKLKSPITNQKWPSYNKNKCKKDEVEIVVQINKIKCKLSSCENLSKEEILNLAKNDSKIKETLNNKELVKTVFVPSKLVNFVVRWNFLTNANLNVS